jgi:hypothetical protein
VHLLGFQACLVVVDHQHTYKAFQNLAGFDY